MGGWMVQFEVLSDIGKKRTVNEDGAAVFTLPEGITLAVIADGMGGHRGGDFASSTAITVIGEEFMKLKDSEFINEMKLDRMAEGNNFSSQSIFV